MPMVELDAEKDAWLISQVIKSSTTGRPVPGLGHVTMYVHDKSRTAKTVKVWTR